MTTFENVVLTPSPATVKTGDMVTIAVSGTATSTSTSTVNVTVNLSTPDGSTGTAVVPLTLSGVSQQPVTVVSATDTNAHVWAVAVDGKSVSAQF